jgi:hypothetical protein
MSLYNFYRSKEWVEFRQIVILERLDEYGQTIDEVTGKPITKAYDIILHHKIPLTESNYMDANISLNPDNIMIVSHKTHNLIHQKLQYNKREVYIVHGSPLAGKTSYVNSVLQQGDLVVDIDNIWECVSGQDRYIKPNRLKSVVFSVRDNLLECIEYRKGKWLNAYVVGSFPFEAERERLCNTLGAKPIHIDTSKEECMLRLENSGRDTKEWTKYINEYWLKYNGGF